MVGSDLQNSAAHGRTAPSFRPATPSCREYRHRPCAFSLKSNSVLPDERHRPPPHPRYIMRGSRAITVSLFDARRIDERARVTAILDLEAILDTQIVIVPMATRCLRGRCTAAAKRERKIATAKTIQTEVGKRRPRPRRWIHNPAEWNMTDTTADVFRRVPVFHERRQVAKVWRRCNGLS